MPAAQLRFGLAANRLHHETPDAALFSWLRACSSTIRELGVQLHTVGRTHDAIVRALGQIARDVELSYTGPAFEPAGQDAQSYTAGLRLLRRASGGQTLELLRPDPDGNGLWQRVHWQVRKDGLWRASGPSAARGPLPAPDGGVLLLPGVRALELRAWVPGTGWVDSNASLASPPAGIEITLERGAPQAPQRFSRILELP